MSGLKEFPSFRSIIELWATRDACAAELGATPAQVSKWWQRNSIPDDWWFSVLKTEPARVAGLTAEAMSRLAAREKVRA